MTGENVMATPIFDQLLREMAQRAEPVSQNTRPNTPPTPESEVQGTSAELSGTRRRHRAE